MRFTQFLLNENAAYLGQRIGDVVNGLQDLGDQVGTTGTRQLIKNATNVVNNIRKILHQPWNKEQEKHLKALQKIAVAIMVAIEEKDDLENVLQSATAEAEKLAGKIGMPINKIGTPEDAEQPDEDPQGVAEPQGKEQPEDPQQQAQAPPDMGQQPQDPNMGQAPQFGAPPPQQGQGFPPAGPSGNMGW